METLPKLLFPSLCWASDIPKKEESGDSLRSFASLQYDSMQLNEPVLTIFCVGAGPEWGERQH